MLHFQPAATNPASQSDADLEPVTHLVQAMRGFICRFTVMLYGYRQIALLGAVNGHSAGALANQPVMRWFMDHAFTRGVVLDLRAMVEDNKKSLGAGAIAHGLMTPNVRAGLCTYLDTCPPERRVTDPLARGKYLDYIAKYAALLATRPKKNATVPPVPPLVTKTELIRRWANKTIAHITLDHYEVHGDDLRDIVFATAFVASAIEKVMGNAGCDTNLVICEQNAISDGQALLGLSAPVVNFMPDIRSIMDLSIQTGTEVSLPGTAHLESAK
jgi:hypothetical protein